MSKNLREIMSHNIGYSEIQNVEFFNRWPVIIIESSLRGDFLETCEIDIQRVSNIMTASRNNFTSR